MSDNAQAVFYQGKADSNKGMDELGVVKATGLLTEAEFDEKKKRLRQ